VTLRDAPQGAKPRARLDALPVFATPQIARKATSHAGWAEIGRFTHQAAWSGVQTALRADGGPIIPISTQTQLPEKSSTDCWR